MLFTLISYLWILFTVTILFAPLVVGFLSRPKKVKRVKNQEAGDAAEEAPVVEQVPEFGDELAEVDFK